MNHCLEIFLRCFIQSSPSKWSDWLYLAEFWYNSSYHSAVQTTPFEILYGYGPTHFGFTMDDCAVSELEGWLRDMHFMHQVIQQHLNRARQQMKYYADNNISFRSFSCGDWVYLKLQPYI